MSLILFKGYLPSNKGGNIKFKNNISNMIFFSLVIVIYINKSYDKNN